MVHCEKMTTKRQDTPFPNLCQFAFSDGRQCSLPAAVGDYCPSHSNLDKPHPSLEADLSSELAQFFSQKDGSLDVHRALERVFKALSANRITNRRAATFGYLGQLILLSKPGFSSHASLSKSDLHDMANITCQLLDVAYPPGANRRASPRPPSPKSSSPKPPSPPQTSTSPSATSEPEPTHPASR
jgi:hypothetical protein